MKGINVWILTLPVFLLALGGCGEKAGEAKTSAAPAAEQQAAAPEQPTVAATADAGESAELSKHPGKALHDANCISCHDSGVYTRADHKMHDFAQLSAQVRRCDANLGTKLFDEDMDNIADYLNKAYYQFPTQ